jgi:hypothetical protein
VHLELAHQAVDDDLQVQLAHPRDERLPGLGIGRHPEGGILGGQLLQRPRQLLLPGLGLGLDHHRHGRRGELDHVQQHRRLEVAQRVAGGGDPQAAGRGDVAGAHRRTSSFLFACICKRRPMRSRLPLVAL